MAGGAGTRELYRARGGRAACARAAAAGERARRGCEAGGGVSAAAALAFAGGVLVALAGRGRDCRRALARAAAAARAARAALGRAWWRASGARARPRRRRAPAAAACRGRGALRWSGWLRRRAARGRGARRWRARGWSARVLRARRRALPARGGRGRAPRMALALADALGGGHSLRGAIAEAARGVGGAAGHELRRVARELRARGADRGRARGHARRACARTRVDTIVAAACSSARAGGDLARLLRDCARAIEEQERLEARARAPPRPRRASPALLVVLLPLGGALLAELASPGYLRGLAGSFLTRWLGGPRARAAGAGGGADPPARARR